MNRNLKPEWNAGVGNMIWYCQGPAVQYCPVYQGLRCKQGPDPTRVNFIVRILKKIVQHPCCLEYIWTTVGKRVLKDMHQEKYINISLALGIIHLVRKQNFPKN